jgi:hypothetical protein
VEDSEPSERGGLVTPLSYAKIVVRRIDTVTLKSFEGNDAETNRRRQRVAGKRQ